MNYPGEANQSDRWYPLRYWKKNHQGLFKTESSDFLGKKDGAKFLKFLEIFGNEQKKIENKHRASYIMWLLRLSYTISN